MHRYLKNLNKINMSDLNSVGGKNASLGEMMNILNKLNLKLPQGYAVTTKAYSDFIKENEINQYIKSKLKNKNLDDIKELNSFGQSIREKILSSKLSNELIEATSIAWKNLNKNNNKSFSVAVRSSATAEDLPNASFAENAVVNISETTRKLFEYIEPGRDK